MAALARLLILAGLAALLCPAPAAAQTVDFTGLAKELSKRIVKQRGRRVVVGEFLGPEKDQRSELGVHLLPQFAEALAAARADLQVLPRDRWVELVEGEKLGAEDLAQPAVARWLAEQAGAEAVAMGRLTERGNVYELTVEVLHVRRDLAVRGTLRVARIEALAVRAAQPAPLVRPDTGRSLALASGQDGIGYPRCKYCPDPRFSEEARNQGVEGTVILMAVVTPDGRATNIRVVKGAAFGLTEQAIRAVQAWAFEPARDKDGKAVAVDVPFEVTFRLLRKID